MIHMNVRLQPQHNTHFLNDPILKANYYSIVYWMKTCNICWHFDRSVSLMNKEDQVVL